MTPEQLAEILRLHKAWISRQPNAVMADFTDADLRGAELRDADLSGACLLEADLRGADLRGTDLRGANGLPIYPDAQQRLRAVAIQVLAQPDNLQMAAWHSDCGTAHCIAGWAIHQAGDLGRQLEAEHGPAVAGLFLLGTEASRHFYDDNATALQWLQSVVEAQP